MTDPNHRDPDNAVRLPDPIRDTTSRDTWIIGALLAVIVMAGIAYVADRNYGTGTGATMSNPAPMTTGSGTVPLPESGQGTAGNAQQSVPPTSR
jgi:hypothetical protein